MTKKIKNNKNKNKNLTTITKELPDTVCSGGPAWEWPLCYRYKIHVSNDSKGRSKERFID